MKLEINLTRRELVIIRQNSLERMVNTAIKCGSLLEQTRRAPTLRERELASTSWQDFEELKPLLLKIWNAVSNQAFIELQTGGTTP